MRRGVLLGALAALVAVVVFGVVGGIAAVATGQRSVAGASRVLLAASAMGIACSAACGSRQALAAGVRDPARALAAGVAGPALVALLLYLPGAFAGRTAGTLVVSLVAAAIGAWGSLRVHKRLSQRPDMG